MEKYKLFYKDCFIASIVLEDKDFPNLFGSYKIENENLPNIIREYIEYSIKLAKFYESSEANEKQLSLLVKNNYNFIDLIECDDWILKDEKSSFKKIHIPNFGYNGMYWRWKD